MTKTLLIRYTPRIDSNTARLAQTFTEASPEQSDILVVDLVKDPPPLLLADNLNALIRRNFMGVELNEVEQQIVASADVLVQQLLDADRIVFAFPMYNFSLPAAVKAWVDAVIQLGKTFTMTGEGAYAGLCHGKKALILMTTGGDFSQEPTKNMNFATPLMQTCLGFMGIESHVIAAYGLNQYMDRADDIVADAQQEIIGFLQQDPAW